MNPNINYEQAFKELQDIVKDIETGNISLDQLASKVKRAAILIKVCKDKITATEDDVQTIINDLDTTVQQKTTN
ncbi:MAG: exodeoxyribonuclease VII small subunit [Phycisphaerales bacterium]|nr:exodeoxyribonuclease VII small subunit [Phycisphaerales bacterium]